MLDFLHLWNSEVQWALPQAVEVTALGPDTLELAQRNIAALFLFFKLFFSPFQIINKLYLHSQKLC